MTPIVPHASDRGFKHDEARLLHSIFAPDFFPLVVYSGRSILSDKPKMISFPFFKNFFVTFMKNLHSEYTEDKYKIAIQNK